MAQSLLSVMQSMRDKIAVLAAGVDQLRQTNRLLEEEIQELRRMVSNLEKERDEARLESEYLTVSHRLASDPDSLIDTRRLIASWIRNIDRCIEMLKE